MFYITGYKLTLKIDLWQMTLHVPIISLMLIFIKDER